MLCESSVHESEGWTNDRCQKDAEEGGETRKAETSFRRQSADRQGLRRRPRARPTSPPCRAGKAKSATRLDALITRAVPGVHKAVKYNSPLYGIEGQGWFLGIHVFTKYIKVAFFRGASLRPVPPGTSKQKHVRYLDIHEDDKLDEKQFTAWVKQASKLPGEKL